MQCRMQAQLRLSSFLGNGSDQTVRRMQISCCARDPFSWTWVLDDLESYNMFFIALFSQLRRCLPKKMSQICFLLQTKPRSHYACLDKTKVILPLVRRRPLCCRAEEGAFRFFFAWLAMADMQVACIRLHNDRRPAWIPSKNARSI